MRWLARWAVRMAALGLLAGAVLVLTGGLLLGTEHGATWVRDRLVAAGEGLGVRTRIGALQGSILFGARLEDVMLSVDGRSLLRVHRARLRWAPWALAWGELRLAELELERPIVRAVRDGEGWIVPPAGGGGGGLRVRVRRLRVRGGRLAQVRDLAGARIQTAVRDVDFDGRVTLGWRAARVVIGRLALRPPHAAVGRVVAHGAVRVRYASGEIRFDGAIGTAASQLAMVARVRPGRALTLAVDAPALAGAELARLLPGLTLPERIALTASARGPWRAIETQARLDLPGLGEVQAAARVDARTWPPRWSVDLAGSSARLAGDRTVRAERLVLRGRQRDRRIDASARLDVPGGRVALDGWIDPTTPPHVEGTFRAEVADLEPLAHLRGALEATGRIRGGAVRAERLRLDTEHVQATGTMVADLSNRTARIEARVTSPTTAERSGVVALTVAGAGDGWRGDGRLTVVDAEHGRLEAEATARSTIDGIVARVAALRLAPRAMPPWRLREAVELRWDGAVLHVPEATLVQGQGQVSLRGRIGPLGGDDEIGMSVALHDVDASGLAPLLPDAIESLEGTLAGRLVVEGRLAEPRLAGEATAALAHVALVGVGTLEDASLRLHAAGDGTLVVDSFVARTRDGEVRGAGRIGITGDAAPLALDLRLRRLRIARRPLYDGLLGGEVALRGTTADPILRGRVTVRQMRLTPRILPEEGASLGHDPTIEVVGEETAPVAADALAGLAPIAVRLRVVVGRDVRLRRRDAEVEVGGEVEVRKDAHGPLRLDGTIAFPNGWYTFKHRRFDLEEGTMRFRNVPGFDPELAVRARHRAPGYDVWVTIGGVASAPTLQLSSEPALPEADVLAILLFGRPLGDLEGNEQSAVQREAGVVAFGYVAPALEASVTELLPVDRLTLSGEEVSVARQMTQDVFLSLSQELTEQGGQTVAVEYDLGRRTTLKVSTSSRGASAIDLFWRRRY